MNVVLISMPDVVPIIIHEMAIHMPNHGIACIGGNIDAGHKDPERQVSRGSGGGFP